MNGRIALLLDVFDQAFDHRAWHGTPLAGAIRGVSHRDALWRPPPVKRRHNIWEIVLHTAYWKYIVRRRRPDASRPFRVPGYPWTPLVFVASAAAIVLNTIWARPQRSLLGLGIVALGLPAYHAWRRAHRSADG